MHHLSRPTAPTNEPAPSSHLDRRENRSSRRTFQRREFRRKEGPEKREGNTNPAMRADRAGPGHQEHKHEHRHEHKTGFRKANYQKGKDADVICWSCGQRGHMANNEICPNKEKGPAIRRMEEDNQEGNNNDSHETELTKSEEESHHIPEMRMMTVHSTHSEDERPYSELDGDSV